MPFGAARPSPAPSALLRSLPKAVVMAGDINLHRWNSLPHPDPVVNLQALPSQSVHNPPQARPVSIPAPRD
jgi:hypothetical protein